MGVVLGTLLVFGGIYLLYMAFHFFLIPDAEYTSYKKALPNIKSAFTGEVNTEREGMVKGDGLDLKTGKLKKKGSYSPEHTKRLFNRFK